MLFLKAFKRKRSAYKNIWKKVTYYIMGRIFCASFLRVQKIPRAKVIYYIMSHYFYASFLSV